MEEKKEIKKETKKGNKTLIVILVVIAVLALLGLIGRAFAGKIKDRFASIFVSKMLSKTGSGNVTFEENGNKVTYQGEDGSVSYEQGGKLPDNFPSDFPIYPGATIDSSWSAEGEDGAGISVVWEAAGSLEEITAFYKEALGQSGWQVTSTFVQQDTSTFSFKKGESEGILGVTEKENGKMAISATFGIE